MTTAATTTVPWRRTTPRRSTAGRLPAGTRGRSTPTAGPSTSTRWRTPTSLRAVRSPLPGGTVVPPFPDCSLCDMVSSGRNQAGRQEEGDMRVMLRCLARSWVVTLAVTGLATMALVVSAAAQPIPPNVDVSVMRGNEAENAIAINPTDPMNIVAMSVLPAVVSGTFEGVSFDGGNTWTRQIIGAGDALGEVCCDQQLAWDRYGNLWMVYLLN